MKVILVLLAVHCGNIPAAAWKFPADTVMSYAKNTLGLTVSQLAYLKSCISRPQPK